MAYDQDNDQNGAWSEDQPRGSNRSPYDSVANWYQQYLGRSGSSDEINSWLNGTGGNLDQIQSGISGSEEARNHANPPAQSQPTSSQPTSSGGQDWSSGPWDANRVSAYFASRGVTPNASSPQYWADKWNEWGKNDPNYFLQRLAAADEIIGGPQNSPFRESGGSSSGSSSSSTPSFNNSFGQFFQPNAIAGGVLPNAPQVSQELIDQLTNRAHQSLAIDPKTDPIIRPQVDNAAATQERSRRSYLNDLAESSNPYATGALNTAATQTAEKAGQFTSGLESQLVQNELTARRQEIQAALEQEGQLLTTDQYLSLQRELDAVNAGLQQQQLSNSFTLGQGQLGLGWGNLGLGYANLGSQNDQFAANYNRGVTQDANYWDWLRRNGGNA